jgi:hypothetical protein
MSAVSLGMLVAIVVAGALVLVTAGLQLRQPSRTRAAGLVASYVVASGLAFLLAWHFVQGAERRRTSEIALLRREIIEQSRLIRESQPSFRSDIRSLYEREDPKRLTRFAHKVYSQNGEDGILQEIFRRIGVTNRYFVEFGSADGAENNTVLLLTVEGWRGLWMDGDDALIERARSRFKKEIESGQLRADVEFVTAENINSLFAQKGVPQEFDLLSIDIDGNDYHLWKSIEPYSPRVVVIEYNAIFQPGMHWVVDYRPDAVWDRTSRFGASLTALERLGGEKGYSLVGCDTRGINAFFVRSDQAGDRFCEPYTAENHYEPPRYGDSPWGGHPRRP